MKPVQVIVYECEHCHQQFSLSYVCKSHEETCLEKMDAIRRAEEAQEQRRQEAMEQAIEIARLDKGLITLVRFGLHEQALREAEHLYNTEIFFDGGCSHWFSEVYRRMVEAIEEQERAASDRALGEGGK